MTAIAETPGVKPAGSRRWVTLAVLLALLVLRMPLVTGSRLFAGAMPEWVSTGFQLGTYLMVAFLLAWERPSLAEHHIPPLALWMIILFKPLQTLILAGPGWAGMHSPLAFPKWPALIVWAAALGLLVLFRRNLFSRGAVTRNDVKWLLLGLLAGLGVVIAISYPMSFQVGGVDPSRRVTLASFLTAIVEQIPYQIGYAAVSEEPVFRGFLWGYLRRSGWRDGPVLLFQAGLFWLAHAYYANQMPISFWIIVPAGALALGWLAWRSRSIAGTMAAHGVMNALGYLTGYLVAFLRS